MDRPAATRSTRTRAKTTLLFDVQDLHVDSSADEIEGSSVGAITPKKERAKKSATKNLVALGLRH